LNRNNRFLLLYRNSYVCFRNNVYETWATPVRVQTNVRTRFSCVAWFNVNLYLLIQMNKSIYGVNSLVLPLVRILSEKYVVKAVANAMKDALILNYNYNFGNEVGELDGLVAGTWNSEEVIVFVEAKHNMDNAWKKAKKQLRSALLYWQKLIDIDLLIMR
jgi:hypothetical protein